MQASVAPAQSGTSSQGLGRGPFLAVAGMILVAVVAGAVISQAGKGSPNGTMAPTSTSRGAPTYPPGGGPGSTPFVPAETPFVPSGGVTSAALGDAVGITCDGDPCMDVTVAKVEFKSTYKDPDGYYNDVPDTKGNVFMAVYITYKATGSNAYYNLFDWNVYVNDTAVDDFAYVLHGPSPELGSGALSVDKMAAGWRIWEVSAKGHVTIEYQPGSNDAIFEVTLRK